MSRKLLFASISLALISGVAMSPYAVANTAANDNAASQLEQQYSGLNPNLSVLGVSGNVGNGPTTGGYSSVTTSTSTATMQCFTSGSISMSPQSTDGAYTLQCLDKISGSTNTLTIQVCPNDGNGAACVTLNNVTPGSSQNTTIEGSQVTLTVNSCANQSAALVNCPTTVATAQTVAGSSSNLAGASTNLSGSNASAFALTNSYGVYDPSGKQLIAPSGGAGTGLSSQMASGSTAQTAANCYGNQNSKMGTGTITNCAGTQSVNFGVQTSANTASCSGSNCVTFTTAGEDTQASMTPTNGLQQAMQAAALADSIKKSITGSLPPTLFPGSFQYCTDQIGCGSTGFACCCDTGVTTSSGLFNNCNNGEAALAGSRRAGLTHQLEYCCGNKILGVCVSHEGSFCAFSSMLGRLIQEQGRQQLAAYAAAGTTSLSNTSVSWNYYAPTSSSSSSSSSAAGAWYGSFTANGNLVWVWQWPSMCAGAIPAGTTTCPQQPGQVWWAACNGSSCSAPTNVPPSSSTQTTLYEIWTSGNNTESRYLSKYVMATGSCNLTSGSSSTCSYSLTGLKAGTAVVASDLGWPLYSTQAGWSATNTLGSNYNFQEYSYIYTSAPAMGGATPTSAPIQYQTVGSNGTTGAWTAANLPLAIPATSPMQLGSGGPWVWGYCDPPNYQCIYHLMESGTSVVKPWDGGSCDSSGNPINADCTGFTIAQFMLLDISQMDLSSWYATINSKYSGNTTAATSANVSKAQSQGSAKQAAANPDAAPTGSQYDNSAYGTSVMQLTSNGSVSSNCQVGTTACQFTLTLTSNWPNTNSNPDYNTAPVKQVVINWGDGSANTTLARSNIATVSGYPMFQTTHTYTKTGNYPITATFTMVQPSSGAPTQSVPVSGLATLGGNCCSPAGTVGYQFPNLIMGNDNAKYLNPGSCQFYAWDITFTLSQQDLSNLYKFLLTQVHWDDWVAILVNGTPVFGGPATGTTQVVQSGSNIIYDAKGDTSGCDRSTNWISSPSLNLIPYLKAGSNDIHIEYAVAGAGHFYAVIDAEEQPYCNSSTPGGCSSSTFATHTAKSQVQVWQDTPPVDQTLQEPNGGVSTIP